METINGKVVSELSKIYTAISAVSSYLGLITKCLEEKKEVSPFNDCFEYLNNIIDQIRCVDEEIRRLR